MGNGVKVGVSYLRSLERAENLYFSYRLNHCPLFFLLTGLSNKYTRRTKTSRSRKAIFTGRHLTKFFSFLFLLSRVTKNLCSSTLDQPPQVSCTPPESLRVFGLPSPTPPSDPYGARPVRPDRQSNSLSPRLTLFVCLSLQLDPCRKIYSTDFDGTNQTGLRLVLWAGRKVFPPVGTGRRPGPRDGRHSGSNAVEHAFTPSVQV